MSGEFDLVSLCLFAILIVVGLMLLTRMMGRASARGGRGGMPTRGPNRPMADDPNIESRGGFGDQTQTGGSSPARRGGGSPFPQGDASSQSARDESGYPGRRGGSLFPQPDDRDDAPPRTGGDKPRKDDPDVESRGGFGRNK